MTQISADMVQLSTARIYPMLAGAKGTSSANRWRLKIDGNACVA
jgi:hypothetical protein